MPPRESTPPAPPKANYMHAQGLQFLENLGSTEMPRSLNAVGLLRSKYILCIQNSNPDSLNYSYALKQFDALDRDTQSVGGEGNVQSIKEQGEREGGEAIDRTVLFWQLYPPLDQ